MGFDRALELQTIFPKEKKKTVKQQGLRLLSEGERYTNQYLVECRSSLDSLNMSTLVCVCVRERERIGLRLSPTDNCVYNKDCV